MIDRAEYLANALSRLEPWRAEESRRTWYRRQGRDVGTSPSAALNEGLELDAPSANPPTPTPIGTGPRPFVPPVTMILSPAELEAARASVAAQYVAMAAEIEARRDWHKLPVPGWREGRLDIRSAMTGETTVVTLRTHKRDAA